MILKCKKFIGEDIETRANGEALILSSTLLFRGCFLPEYYNIIAQKVNEIVQQNIPDIKLMVFLKNINFSEINLKDDIDKVRVFAFLIDKPIIFIDPNKKSKQILLPVFKHLQVRNYN